MSEFFKEEVEHRRERARSMRFGGWIGLLLKISVIAILFWMVSSVGFKSVGNLLWFLSGGTSANSGFSTEIYRD